MSELRNVLDLKPGLRTTEFWAHTIASGLAALVGIGVIPVGLPDKYQAWVQLGAIVASALCTGLYALSRARVKAGPSTYIQMFSGMIEALADDGDHDGALKLLGKVFPELNEPPQIAPAAPAAKV